jgi:hypothetical protein
MAGPYYFDRVKDTSTTTGTGTLTLANSAPTGFRTFGSVLSNSDTCFYAIVGGADWEVGIGTYTTSGTTLARTTILASSNSNAAVNLSSGTKDIFITHPASQFQWMPAITPPVPGDFTTVGTVTRSTTDGGVSITRASSGNYTWGLDYKAAPSTPFNVDMCIQIAGITRNTHGLVSALWRDSGGKLVSHGLFLGAGSQSTSYKWDGPNNQYNSAYYQETASVAGGFHWFRLRDDGTNRLFYSSPDGITWDQLHTVGRTDFLTANGVGWGVCGYNMPITAKLISWKES